MKRPLVALMALAAALTGSGQSCFRVVEGSHDTGVAGCVVRCVDGEGPWYTDQAGLICLRSACDSVRIEKPGFQSTWVNVAVARTTGYVRLAEMVTDLRAMEVEPWPRRADRQALAALSTVDSSLLAGFERSGLRSAALYVPGVQWDERGHGGSQRLSIRGSLLRSPFGVRGVKVYWGAFPLTLADGSTPLELLDPMLAGSVDIVRSVGSPVYGSAPSGLVLAQAPFRPENGSDATIETTGGSFGYYRLGALARTNEGPAAITVGLVRQRNDGYREQEWSARDQAFIATRFRHKRSISQVFLTWQKASWALPGSLDEQTAEDDPRSARPYSVLLDAHLEKQQVMGGMSNELRMGERTLIRGGFHAQLIDKENPYGTSPANCGYKTEEIRAAGARLSIASDHRFRGVAFAWEAGLEALVERDDWLENSYVDGTIGALKVDADTRVVNMNAFALTTTRLGQRTIVHAGLGSERTAYDHEDHLTSTTNEVTGDPTLLPYAGVEHVFGNHFRARLRYAESTSRPTVWELLGTTGTFNDGLQGERVREWEVGASSDAAGRNITSELALYHREVRNLIVPETVAEDEPYAYSNAGTATITGVEFILRRPMAVDSCWPVYMHLAVGVQISELRQPAATGEDLLIEGIPGVPAMTIAAVAREPVHRSIPLSIELGVRLSAPVTVQLWENGGGTVNGYHVEHARLVYELRGSSWTAGFFLHCENLLDVRYSSWITVGDPGYRYFNPAPARSFCIGGQLTFGSTPPLPAD